MEYVDTLPVFVCFDFEEQDVLKLFGIKDTDGGGRMGKSDIFIPLSDFLF